MTKKEEQHLLKQIQKGIKEFPKVLARQKAAHKEKEKRVKAFGPIVKALQKQIREKEKLDQQKLSGQTKAKKKNNEA